MGKGFFEKYIIPWVLQKFEKEEKIWQQTSTGGTGPTPPPPPPPITPLLTSPITTPPPPNPDTTPPVIQMTQTPPPNTNSSSAYFLFGADEAAPTFSYSLDSGSWATTGPSLILGNLSEGTHTLEVKATDTSGNTSGTVSYSWTTDYTPPAVSIPTRPPENTNQNTATFGFGTTEPSTYSYRLDGGSWTATGSSLTLMGLSESAHTLEVRAVDGAGNPSSIASYSWRTDYTPPIVSIPTKPPENMNQSTATFGFSTSETSTHSYRLDGGAWISTGSSLTLSGLSEGNHQIEVKATDMVGNTSSPVSYSWTTDFTLPVVTATPSATPVDSTTGINITLSSNETATLSYRFDGGAWTSTLGTVSLLGIAEGHHTFEYLGTDSAGNTSSNYSLPFDLSRFTLTGAASDFNGFSMLADVSGGIAAIYNQDWGGYITSLYNGLYESEPSGPFEMLAGGTNDPGIGYWLSLMNMNASGGILSGTSSLKHITTTTLGFGIGTVSGTYGGGTWGATDQGQYISIPLTFVSEISANLLYYNGISPIIDGSLSLALMGGIQSLWTATETSPALVTMIGKYTPSTTLAGHTWSTEFYSYNYLNSTKTTYDDGAYRGYIGGIKNTNDSLEGEFIAIYVDPSGHAGYLIGDLDGVAYPLPVGMFNMGGIAYPIQIFDNIGINPNNLYSSITQSVPLYGLSGSGSFNPAGTISINSPNSSRIEQYTPNRELTIWKSVIFGTYSGTTSNSWELKTFSNDFKAGYLSGTATTGTLWSSNKLDGSTYGYIADFNKASTWIGIGETIGTYDPSVSSWQAIQAGLYLNTNQFLAMRQTPEGQAKLQQLNIPCVEIGRTNLTGSWASKGSTINVNMNDTIFFAPNTGQRPKIWVTGNLNGTYTGNPKGASVSLSGGGLSANFNVSEWSGKKWLSQILNGGAPSGIGSYSSTFYFNGGAAGTYGSGIFTGTAAGVATNSP